MSHPWTYHHLGDAYRRRPRQPSERLVPAALDWWTAHKSARLEARRASLNACWDATRKCDRRRRAAAGAGDGPGPGFLTMASHPYSLIE